jgi:hypothetical protein
MHRVRDIPIPYRPLFDPARTFIVARELTLDGKLRPGEVFPRDRVTLNRLRQLFNGGWLRYKDEAGKHLSVLINPSQPRLLRARAAPMPKPPPLIPDNWRDLGWGDIRRLFMKLTRTTPTNRDEALEAIEAWYERQQVRARDLT